MLVLDSATKYSMKSNSKQRHYHATNAKFHYRKLLVLKGEGNFNAEFIVSDNGAVTVQFILFFIGYYCQLLKMYVTRNN